MIAEEITEEYVNLHCDIERLLQSATHIIMKRQLL
jgi:hypothetical protein